MSYSVGLLYSPQTISIVAKLWAGTGRTLQEVVDANPAMCIDHTYNSRSHRGLRQENEIYRLHDVPVTWVKASMVDAEDQTTHLCHALRYCAVEQRTKISLSGAKALQHTLSMVSWKAGAARPSLDIGTFCSKSFVCGAIQEGAEEMIAQPRRHGRQVFKANNPRNTATSGLLPHLLGAARLLC